MELIHTCYRLTDMDPPYRVREGSSRLRFIRDPDGCRVELIERSG